VTSKERGGVNPFKIVFLSIESASKKWTMPIRDWNAAINQFMIIHEDRLDKYL